MAFYKLTFAIGKRSAQEKQGRNISIRRKYERSNERIFQGRRIQGMRN
jgi:hypothetical protein